MKLGVRRGRWAWAGAAVLITLVALAIVPSASPEQAASKVRRLPAGFLDAGGAQTCAVFDNRTVRCWGSGGNGRLGYGNLNDIGDTEVPASVGVVDVGASRGTIAISSGGSHNCALLDTRQVRCWGLGGNGRLGYGNENDIGDNETPGSAGPVDLGTGRVASAITAGGAHTCTILDTSQVRCWGAGANGRLGYGNTNDIGDNETPGGFGPVDLGSGRTAIAISAGTAHTCALLDTGQVRCWGAGGNGRLGYGNTTAIGDNETPGGFGPVDLGAGRTAIAISAGGSHTCAILDTGQVRCWGNGANGRLGYGNLNDIGDNETPGSIAPVDLGAGRTAVAISSGTAHTCAILDTGQVRCWGLATNGRLGYGNLNDIGDNETPGSVAPVDLGAGRLAVAISAGGAHTCALLTSGQVLCWGAGANGRLGYANINDIGDNETPATVVPVNAGGIVSPSVLPTLTLTLKPKRDRKAPFRFGTSGALGGFLVDASTCTGQVTLKAKKGKRLVTRKATLKLGPGVCNYTAAFRVKSRGKWKVTAAFGGNGSVRARSASARVFRAG
jgi:alpha-tubulin suppressor-like RCC1 family protein